ncbi:hypothetical protein DR64_6962 [Paraburkholderia xenovorans LB400]|jgi:hypothetical protein|nr:hypothetical protein DR64_6962 [Paraburkholderia xenovorans LB400]
MAAATQRTTKSGVVYTVQIRVKRGRHTCSAFRYFAGAGGVVDFVFRTRCR